MIQRRVRSVTLASDPMKALIGTSPYPGDLGYLGVVIPATPSSNYKTRHLVRLCTVAVPEGEVGRVLSIGQLLTMRACVPAALLEEQQRGSGACGLPSIYIEAPVTTPWWSFQDGNVSWHLMYYQAQQSRPLAPNLLSVPTQDNDINGTDAAVLVAAFGAAAPLNQGVPPGFGMGNFGIWHSLDYPWPGRTIDMAYQPEVRGPCIIGLFASIYQTDPEHRLIPATGAGIEQITIGDGMAPEDAFVLAYPDSARYHRVAGALDVEISCVARRADCAPEVSCPPPGSSCHQVKSST